MNVFGKIKYSSIKTPLVFLNYFLLVVLISTKIHAQENIQDNNQTNICKQVKILFNEKQTTSPLKITLDGSQCSPAFQKIVYLDASGRGDQTFLVQQDSTIYEISTNIEMNSLEGEFELLNTKISKHQVVNNESEIYRSIASKVVKQKQKQKKSFAEVVTPAIEPIQVTQSATPALASISQSPSSSVPLFSNATATTLQVYGTLLPTIFMANDGVGSYGRVNMVAPTEAISGVNTDKARSSMQAQQSRIGVNISTSSTVQGKLEVDFVDFTKSSPTVQSFPRLRLAKIDYKATEDVTIFMGQEKEVFSPLAPYTYNIVGAQFRAGNSASMRQQLGANYKLFQNLELSGSYGFGSPNTFATDQENETRNSPALSARVGYLGEQFKIYLSGIYSKYSYYTDTTNGYGVDQKAQGFCLSSEFNSDSFQMRSEVYEGQNLANIFLLTIGQARSATDVMKEVGGYVSAKFKKDNWGTWLTFGGAYMRDQEKINAATVSTAGMISNQAAKIGFDYKLQDKLFAFYEFSYFKTKYFNGTPTASLNSVGLAMGF